jgi:hypothetical protein
MNVSDLLELAAWWLQCWQLGVELKDAKPTSNWQPGMRKQVIDLATSMLISGLDLLSRRFQGLHRAERRGASGCRHRRTEPRAIPSFHPRRFA